VVPSKASTTLDYFRFSPPIQYQPLLDSGAAVEFRNVVIGDVTGDNRDDIVAMRVTAPTVYVLVQRPDGTLDSPREFVYGPPTDESGWSSLALGDMNEDGVLDIVTSSMNGSGADRSGVNVILSDGAGGLKLQYVPDDGGASGQGWIYGVLVDVDLDGHLDLAAYEAHHEPYNSTCGLQYCKYRKLLYGDGKGGFPRRTTTALNVYVDYPLMYPPADMNGDGILDLALLVTLDVVAGERAVRIYYNDRNGGYAWNDRAPIGSVFGDFDHNGLNDIVRDGANGFTLFPQVSPGKFGTPIGPIYANHPFSPGLLGVDLDRNGTTDLLSGQFECFSGGGCNPTYLQTYVQLNGILEATPERPYVEGTSWEPQLAAGDINGDGCTDAVVAGGQNGMYFLYGSHCHPAPAARNDFDGDHASDVVWHDAATGASNTWQGGSTDQRRFVTTVDPTRWALATTGDFDGDGRADMLWRHRSTGMNILWMAGNARVTRTLATVSNPAWRIVGTGDFNRDRKADLVWRNGTTGQTLAWLSGNSATTMNFATVADQAWQIADIGDYDGDGRDDLFWRHGTRGLNTWWRAGNAAAAIAVVAVATHWKVVGSGDFDRDGKDDLVWRGGNGVNAIWRSANSATQLSIATVTDTAWQIAAIGDYDDDGRDDLLWRNNTTGANRLWRKGDASQQRFVATVATRWKAVR
jgi:hypothetical protein